MKISIIGAGNVGSLTALRIAQEELGEIILVDVVKGLAEGKAFDLQDCRYLVRSNYEIQGTDDIANIKGSDIVVITAGLPRKPGMTREDLLNKNAEILKSVCVKITALSADAIVIVVTNPLDVMAYFVLKTTGFKPHKVFGMGVTLDGARFANIISKSLKVKNTDVKPTVIGSHGETMLPLARFTYVKAQRLTEAVEDKKVNELIERTKKRGQEIISLLGSGSAYFAPSAAIAELVRAIVKDEKSVLGVSAYLNGEYGVKDICIGVPCVLGKNGIEQIVELELNNEEKEAFLKSADSIRILNKLLTI